MTIAFRVSPEENEEIQRRVSLSGLTKQEYISRRCQEKDIVVIGNPRVYAALKKQMLEILDQLKKIEQGDVVDPDLQDTIRVVAMTMAGMKDDRKGNV